MFNPIECINTVFNYIGTTIVLSSYYVCIVGGLIGLLLYIFGYEKGKNYPLISIGLYLIINIIGRALFNV